MNQWEIGMHARIAHGIKQARGSRSAQWLADRTAELGYPISRSQIANYESGRKKGLDIAELVILAAALEVPPVALVYPNLPDGEVEVVPGEFDTAIDAVRWFTAEGYDSPDYEVGSNEGLSRLLRLSRLRKFNIVRAQRQEKYIAKFGERSRVDYDQYVREFEGLIREVPGAILQEYPGTPPAPVEANRDA